MNERYLTKKAPKNSAKKKPSRKHFAVKYHRLLFEEAMGPLHDPVTWFKITQAGTQVAQCDFQNKATRTSPP